jgi:hypothetical protein
MWSGSRIFDFDCRPVCGVVLGRYGEKMCSTDLRMFMWSCGKGGVGLDVFRLLDAKNCVGDDDGCVSSGSYEVCLVSREVSEVHQDGTCNKVGDEYH